MRLRLPRGRAARIALALAIANEIRGIFVAAGIAQALWG